MLLSSVTGYDIPKRLNICFNPMKIYIDVSPTLSGAVSPVCWLYVIMKPCVGGIVPLGSLANFVFIHPQAKITQTIFFTPDRGVSLYTRSSCSTQELTIALCCSNTQKNTTIPYYYLKDNKILINYLLKTQKQNSNNTVKTFVSWLF